MTPNSTPEPSPRAFPNMEVPTREMMDFKQKILHRSWVNREAYLLSRCRDFKNILHVGCSDAPFTEPLLKSGKLLHPKILQIKPNSVGFDQNANGVQRLQRACPDGTFQKGDFEAIDVYFSPGGFDLIAAGEILEKLSNPGAFLEACAKLLRPDGVLLLTVPSAFGLRRYVHNILGVENCHPEHTFYFSEKTILTLAKRHKFSVFRSHYYRSPHSESWLKRALYTCVETIPAYILGSHFLDGIVIELKKQI
ncbi:MAG: class I SAM-dependent methyltransferase [Bacteriovoracia bacterium]